MQKLWVSRNLREHWEEWLRDEIYSKESGKILLATIEQKRALKNWILEEKKGVLGWTLLTRSEEERRLGGLGLWELEIVGRFYCPSDYWEGLNKWAAEVFNWGYAGYRLQDIPFKGIYLSLTDKIEEVLRKNSLKLGCEINLSMDFIVGFDPLSCWRLRGDKKIGLVAEAELTAPQMSAISFLEKTMGDFRFCDNLPTNSMPAIKVSSVVDLKTVLKELLIEKKEIKRILYQGSNAFSAVLALEKEIPGKLNFSAQTSWLKKEKLVSFREVQENAPTFGMDWQRTKIVNQEADFGELKKIEKKLKEQWECSGGIENLELKEKLSKTGSLKSFKEETQLYFKEETESLINRLRPIEKLFPKEISRDFWLELLSAPKPPQENYGGVTVLPFERALGLIDSSALVVWSEPIEAPSIVLIDLLEVEKRNKVYFQEEPLLEKGYLEVSKHRQLLALKKEAIYQSCWVGVEGSGLPKEINWVRRVYKKNTNKKVSTELFEGLKTKHAQRINTSVPFGKNDYTLPLPVKVSCKQWETVVTSPELAWYEAIKQRPLWKGAQENPSALWVGNWVHEAMKVCRTLQEINLFFKKTENLKASLVWRRAHRRAWGLSYGFFLALEAAGVKTLAVEEAVKGELILGGEKISLTGRIDRLIELPNGRELILDFKTSTSASTVTDKRLQIGDGLQLWLYARLLKKEKIAGLCRLPPDGKISEQVDGAFELPEVEKEISRIAQSGALGQKGEVWGRFGADDRLPLATLPVDRRIASVRRKASV